VVVVVQTLQMFQMFRLLDIILFQLFPYFCYSWSHEKSDVFKDFAYASLNEKF